MAHPRVFAISICPMQDPDTIISDREIHSRRVEANKKQQVELHAELAVVRCTGWEPVYIFYDCGPLFVEIS